MYRRKLLALTLLVVGVFGVKVLFSPPALSATCPLTVNRPYKVLTLPTIYYITPVCTKQIILNTKTYYSWFPSFSAVRITSQTTLNQIPYDQVKYAPLKTSATSTTSGSSGSTAPTTSVTCTSFTYSNWSVCSNGTQTRTLISSSPTGCKGGSPKLSQTCSMGTVPTPYTGTAVSVPGTIQAENFDNGGEGVAYHNIAAGVTATYRPSEAVETLSCNDGSVSCGTRIGYSFAGEWYGYTINVTAAGSYTIQIRYATPEANQTVHFELDGTTVGGTISLPTTGSWTKYATVTSPSINFTAGKHFLKLVADTSSTDFDYYTIGAVTVSSCTSFTYSDWGVCQSNNTQTRTVISQLPSGCTGGSPALSQSCVYNNSGTVDSITLSSNSQLMIADGISSPTLTTVCSKSGTTVTCPALNLYVNGNQFSSTKFTTTNAGQYALNVKSGTASSNSITVTARAKETRVKTLPIIIQWDTVLSGVNPTAADAQAIVDELNAAYSHVTSTDPNSGDTGIRFKLATTGPNGETLPIAGINKIDASPYDNGGGSVNDGGASVTGDRKIGAAEARSMVKLSWDPRKYINIYIVPATVNTTDVPKVWSNYPLGGLSTVQSGTSYEPNANNYPILMIDTTAAKNGVTVPHEMGHYLGLLHVFSTDNCATSDYAPDTYSYDYNTYAACSDNQGISIRNNMMDYGLGFDLYFTYDQAQRMHWVLEHGVWLNQLTSASTQPPTTNSYPVNVTITGQGTVTCNGGSCASNFTQGSIVALIATPASGYTFSSWGGACSGIDGNTCNLTIGTNNNVSATFTSGTTPPPSGSGSTPYTGTAISVPGTIQAENFDNGGEGVAYHNIAAGVTATYRPSEAVETLSCTDGSTSCGTRIGYSFAGEWYGYTINVTTAGSYTIQIRYATPEASQTVHFELDGTRVGGTISLPTTGSWTTYATVTSPSINFTAGKHFLKLVADSSSSDFDYFTIGTATASTCTSFTYSEWGACTNNYQTRTVLSSSPSGCAGGSPVLSQGCGTTPVSTDPGPLGAFPGCQGSGCKTRGGFASGSKVYFVTSLSGGTESGTLGACIAASGPRVCLFKVAGTIASSGYSITNGNLTIDCESAPGDGIQITQQSSSNVAVFFPKANDIVIRGCKIRPGRNAANPGDLSGVCGINMIGSSVNRFVVDHSSIQWANGDEISMWGPAAMNDITYSWSIIGEGLDLSHSSSASGYSHNINMGGNSYSGDSITNVDYNHNFIANANERGLRYKTKSGRVVNNIMYNAQDPFAFVGGAQVDVIGNITHRGPYDGSLSTPWYYGSPITIWYEGLGSGSDWSSGSPSVYATGNVDDVNETSGGTNNWSSGIIRTCSKSGSCSVSTAYRRTSPLATTANGIDIKVDSYSAAVGTPGNDKGTPTGSGVLGMAGAVRRIDCGGNVVMRRDALDARMIRSYPLGSGLGTGLNHVPFSEKDTPEGGFPSIGAVSATCSGSSLDNTSCVCADSDNDGIPNFYEHAWTGSDTGMDPTATSVYAPFTNLEAYLSGQAGKTSYTGGSSSGSTCTSFTYSAWGSCVNGSQTRSVTASSPDGCTGGNPILSQTCSTQSNSYPLNVTITGQGTVTCNGGSCSGNFTQGSVVTLVATPASGYTFSSWGGACSGIDGNTCGLTIGTSNNVSATFSGGSTSSNTPTPYTGTAISVPGTIQAENFDNGGEGVAYHNIAAGVTATYRPSEAVETLSCTDGSTSCGTRIGYSFAGEWYGYTINVTTAGSYTIQIRYATPEASQTVHFELDGTRVGGTISLPTTGSWTTYATVTSPSINFTSGKHFLKLVADTSSSDFDYFTIGTATASTCTSFTYSAWGTCSNNVQTRTVTSQSPSGCTGGSPVLSQGCTTQTSGGPGTGSSHSPAYVSVTGGGARPSASGAYVLTGASGNGTTDDTAALQAAINTAASQGKALLIPKPSNCYRVTRGANYLGILDVKTSIIGDGSYPKICVKPGEATGEANYTILHITNYTGSGIVVAGLTLDGGFSLSTAGSGKTGGGVDGAGSGSNHWRSSGGEWSNGMELIGSKNVTIMDNYIQNVVGDGIALRSPVCSNIIVKNNTIFDTYRVSLFPLETSKVAIIDNILKSDFGYARIIDVEPNNQETNYDLEIAYNNMSQFPTTDWDGKSVSRCNWKYPDVLAGDRHYYHDNTAIAPNYFGNGFLYQCGTWGSTFVNSNNK